jgi:hypothetical protein
MFTHYAAMPAVPATISMALTSAFDEVDDLDEARWDGLQLDETLLAPPREVKPAATVRRSKRKSLDYRIVGFGASP